jgi:alkanesulfonate monooxygenase SsuD/methylene tetrahydromethanopterin reductase-like flavin-dependent oxidoreductase (luciferase family)
MPHAVHRAIAYGDGWIPVAGRGEDVLDQLPRFRQVVAEANRDPDSITVSIFGAEMDLDRLKKYRDAGCERVVFDMATATADEALPVLDKITSLMHSMD